MKTFDKLSETNILSDEFINYCNNNIEFLNSIIDYEKDKKIDFFGLRTLMKTYLLKDIDGNIVESPQHLFLREAIQVNLNKINNENIKKTYEMLSNLYYTHATPTLFNSGTKRPQLSSCFLMSCDDSIDSIAKTWEKIAHISKYAGGVGISLSDIRGKDSKIKSTNGKSDGIIPLCRVYQSIALYVNQSGKRNGSIAVYLEPWHCDIFAFIDLRRITGNETEKARDLFLGLWVPDIFMERVKNNDDWYLMTPDVCENLTTTYGSEFNELYLNYVKENKYVKKIKAVELYQKILEAQLETGMPYMCFKDTSNIKSNQKNLGTIKCSNLCSEIILYTSDEEIATCNLASISLPKYVENKRFNYELLGEVVERAIYNLDNVIDVNFYPTEETKTSNFRHRPLGLGISGLTNLYFKMGYGFDSPESFNLNKKVFECIYYHALKSSNELAIKYGYYSTFENSPFSNGILQFHMCNKNINDLHIEGYPDFNWEELIKNIKLYGTRHSQLTALMPTASTSQILGSYECFEPYASNIFVRKMGKHDIVVVNNHLIEELKELNLWDNDLYNELIYYEGSVQSIKRIPEKIKRKYKTAFELQQSILVKQAVDRSLFIDQSQSLNIFMEKPDFNKLSKSHFYAWQNGLKTGSYYIRSKPPKTASKFGLDGEFIKRKEIEECLTCSA
jgi:ribonucleoside-diphosphate reductase alpha chain